MIRIGIIGCGKIAQVRHLPEYAANPHVELAGYYDLNTQRAQEMAAQYGGKVYDSYFDLLNDPSIDAVSICVENRSHAEITTYALYAGKHVLCEKPMAVTLAECESMVAAAERNGKHLMIGHNMRFDPVHRKAKELLDGGIIGDIVSIKDDSIVIETTTDRVRVEFAKFAVSTNNTAEKEAAKQKAAALAARKEQKEKEKKAKKDK